MSDLRYDRDPAHLWPPLASKISLVLDGLQKWCVVHAPHLHPAIGETFRTASHQKAVWAEGRTTPGKKVTQCDGVHSLSNHQRGMACDIWLLDDKGRAVWPDADAEVWAYLAHLARANGLAPGHDWKRKDCPHVEWPTTDKASYKLAKAWQRLQTWYA